MIVTFFLNIIFAAVRVIATPILFLPNVSVESGLSTTIAEATAYLASINEFFPLNTTLIILGLVFSIEAIIIVYKLIMWVIRRIPTQS